MKNQLQETTGHEERPKCITYEIPNGRTKGTQRNKYINNELKK